MKRRSSCFQGYVFVTSENAERLFHGLKKVLGLTKLLGGRTRDCGAASGRDSIFEIIRRRENDRGDVCRRD